MGTMRRTRVVPFATVAGAALDAYDLRVVRRRLLARSHNVTFGIDCDEGRRLVLKLQPPGMGPAAEAHGLSEMLWLDALARQTDLLVPAPVRSRSGELLERVSVEDGTEPWVCRVMTWVPDRKLGRSMNAEHFALLGTLIAGLHGHAARWSPPEGFVRPRWSEEFGVQLAHLRRAAADGRLPRARAECMDAAADRARRAMSEVGTAPDVFHLIHSDLGYGNHLFHRGRAGAIDFEKCAYGWALADLAEPLCWVQHVPHFPALRDALLAGYRAVRPLSRELESRLPDFLDFAAVATLGYIANEPARADDLEGLSAYAAKTLRPPR